MESIMTKIINCTPHTINVVVEGTESVFPASGIIPRVSVFETEAEMLGDFPCVTTKTGAVKELPEFTEGVFLIVSGMVFAASNRTDLIAPDTGSTAIRNEKGHIVAVTRFIRK